MIINNFYKIQWKNYKTIEEKMYNYNNNRKWINNIVVIMVKINIL